MVYVDQVNIVLKEFSDQWNNHPISTESNYSPPPATIGSWNGISMHSPSTAVQDVINLANYGIDESGPVPQQQQNYEVFVPQSAIRELTQARLHWTTTS